MTIVPDAEKGLRRAGLDDVGRVLRSTGDRVMAWSRTSDTIRVRLNGEGRSAGYFVKRYHYPGRVRRVWHMILSVFGMRDRAQLEFEVLRSCASRELPVVRAVATARRKRFGMLHSAFLITEEFDGSESLSESAARGIQGLRERRAIIGELAGAIARLHRAGVIHGQLFWRNILVRPSDAGRYDIRLIDFAVGSGRKRRARSKARDLGALGSLVHRFASRADCVRFMRAYAATSRLDPAARVLLGEAARFARGYRGAEERRLVLAELFRTDAVDATEAGATGMKHQRS